MVNKTKIRSKGIPRGRKGGRPFGSGPWGEATEYMRIPLSVVPDVINLLSDFINKGGIKNAQAAKATLNEIEERHHGRKNGKKAKKCIEIARMGGKARWGKK